MNLWYSKACACWIRYQEDDYYVDDCRWSCVCRQPNWGSPYGRADQWVRSELRHCCFQQDLRVKMLRLGNGRQRLKFVLGCESLSLLVIEMLVGVYCWVLPDFWISVYLGIAELLGDVMCLKLWVYNGSVSKVLSSLQCLLLKMMRGFNPKWCFFNPSSILYHSYRCCIVFLIHKYWLYSSILHMPSQHMEDDSLFL
jgi:hypothetical protein